MGDLKVNEVKTETIAHSNGTTAMTIASNGDVSGVVKTFTSAETTISASTKTTFTHGLGAIPFQFDLYLICKTAADGYAVGDIIKVTQGFHSTAGTTAIGAIMSADATNIFLTTGGNAAGGMFKGFNQDTGGDVTFSNSNYKMIVKAWV
tara:strand:+ start:4998 stop:5444 length:447 start_codon:yes stop_codon:yes gene_type:complete